MFFGEIRGLTPVPRRNMLVIRGLTWENIQLDAGPMKKYASYTQVDAVFRGLKNKQPSSTQARVEIRGFCFLAQGPLSSIFLAESDVVSLEHSFISVINSVGRRILLPTELIMLKRECTEKQAF